MRSILVKNLNSKHFFKYITSRKPAGMTVGPLDNKTVKGLLKEDRETEKDLSAFFESVFSIKYLGHLDHSWK